MATERTRRTSLWIAGALVVAAAAAGLHEGAARPQPSSTTEVASEPVSAVEATEAPSESADGERPSSATGGADDASFADPAHAGDESSGGQVTATAAAAMPNVGDEVWGATEHELRRAGMARNEEEAAFYRNAAKYPSDNRVLTAGRDPLMESSAGSHSREPAPDGHSLELATSDWSVVSGNSIAIHGTLRDPAGNVVPIASARAMLMDTAMTGYEEIIALHADALGVAQGELTAPDATTVALDPGVHKLVLEASDALGRKYLATSALQVSGASVTLTGRMRESLEAGGLSVEAEVRATGSTRVHLAMTLAPADAVDGTRILAQRSVPLSPGVQWVRVQFAGISLRALQKDGPYLVTAVQLHDVSSMPPARLPLLQPGFVTQSYTLAMFDETPADDKWLSTMARFLENR